MKTDLSLVDSGELIDELARRFDTMVFAASRSEKDSNGLRWRVKGDDGLRMRGTYHALGTLMDQAGERDVSDMLNPKDRL